MEASYKFPRFFCLQWFIKCDDDPQLGLLWDFNQSGAFFSSHGYTLIYFSASVNYSMTEEAGTRQIRNATHFAFDLLSWVMVKKFNSVMAPFTLSIEMVDINPISSFSFFIGPVMQYDHQSRSLWSMCFDGIVFVRFHK